MKKTIIILISLVVVCNIIATISKPDADMDNESQLETETIQETQATQETTCTEQSDTAIIISSDEYFDIVHNAIKSRVELAGYSITSISTLRMPYYMVDCKATNIDTTNFKAETLKIAEDIYDAILEYEYKEPDFFKASHEIISLTFYVIENGKTTNGLCIQFDLTDVDRTKSFLENLKTPITP